MSLNEITKQKLIDSTGNRTGAVIDSSKLELEKEFVKNLKLSNLSQLVVKEGLDNKGLQRTRLELGLDYDDAAGASHYAKSVLYSIWDDDFRKGKYGTINANEFYSDLFSRETILTYHQILSDEIDVTGDTNYTKAEKSKFVNEFETNLQRSFGLRKSDVSVIRDMFKDKAYLFDADFNAIMKQDASNVLVSQLINQPSGNLNHLYPVVSGGTGWGGYKPVMDNLEELKEYSKKYGDSQPSLKPKSVKVKRDYPRQYFSVGIPPK